MPYYDYKSDDGEVKTVQRSIHETPVEFIRSAGKVFRRVFYPIGVIYNTTGFYTTDSADSITKWQRENMKGL